MRRVDDDDVGILDRLEHPPLGDLALDLSDPALDLRIAFPLLRFVSDLLLRHPELLLELPVLPEEVESGEHREDRQDDPDGPRQKPAADPTGVERCSAEQRKDLRERRLEGDPENPDDHDEPEDRLHELVDAVEREHALQPGDRVEFFELEGQRLARKEPADLGDVRYDADRHEHQCEGREGETHPSPVVEQQRMVVLEAVGLDERPGPGRARDPDQHLPQIGAERRTERDRTGREQDDRPDVAALGDLTLFARVLALLGSRGLGLVLFIRHAIPRPALRIRSRARPRSNPSSHA